MKLNDLIAHLVPILGRPLSDFTELLRALREQSAHFGESARTALQARPGPGGGLEADPFRTGFLLVGLMVQVERRQVADAVWNAWLLGQDANFSAGKTLKVHPCPLTGKRTFGEAFMAVLGDPKLAARVTNVIIEEGGVAAGIEFDNKEGSFFSDSEISRKEKTLKIFAKLDALAINAIAGLLARG